MLVLLALAIAVIVLLATMNADAIWFTFVPTGILVFGALVAHSLGWFNKKAG
ncbi:hypothetical protein ACLQ2N_22410 [Streptomyces sp. DT224]|uniref:hypothetical protein n=1 Tax=Streptomyces sp. DT224 TaxID=3393426 RepID=UPI003CF3D132